MQTTTTFSLLFIAVFSSIAIAFYQYLYKNKAKKKSDFLLFALRALSIFLMLLLFINPTIESVRFTNEKPILTVLVDHSASISYTKQDQQSIGLVNTIANSKRLTTKFDLQLFSFGTTISPLANPDSLTFLAPQTNISDGIQTVNELNKAKKSAIILVTDGNQTIGNDYEFITSTAPIYPVVIGDTAVFTDVRITQVNVNKYSYLKNKFPVESFLFYDGNEKITTQFSISQKGKVLFRKNVTFSPTERSKTITTNLTATTKGSNYYTASLQIITGEKNIANNTSTFAVDVLNEQTNILIVTSVVHPDIGALKKAIESNKQRKVEVNLITDFKNQINDYQLIILYQPTRNFKNIFQEIQNKKANYLVITGAQTDWNFMNRLEIGVRKNALYQTENYSATFNPNFLPFIQNDIGFSDFPPLTDQFGEVSLQRQYQTLLYQNIAGIASTQPLFAVSAANDQKSALLFGEGVWKWRAASFLQYNNFQVFDDFTGNLVQFLATNKKRSRIEVTAKSLYNANETITMAAFYRDGNYQFDPRANVALSYTNLATKETKKVPFSLKNNAYTLTLEDLASGEYSYVVSVAQQTVKKYGSFNISEYNVEEQFTNANKNKLGTLALNSQGKSYYPEEVNLLISNLIADNNYFTTQKSAVIQQHFIDWKWILMIVIFLLALEWFIRKYHGKV